MIKKILSGALFKAGLIAVAVIIPTVASFAYAATYAYVKADGEVSTVTADDWNTAIMTAPNRHMHSGVLLLDSSADEGIVGDDVAGI